MRGRRWLRRRRRCAEEVDEAEEGEAMTMTITMKTLMIHVFGFLLHTDNIIIYSITRGDVNRELLFDTKTNAGFHVNLSLHLTNQPQCQGYGLLESHMRYSSGTICLSSFGLQACVAY